MDGNLALYEPIRIISNKNKTSIVRVVYYGRVSTQHEAQINAFSNQLEFYSDVLKKHPNWELVGNYYDKGLTGTIAVKRPGFMQIVNTDELVHTARSSSACFPVFQCTLSAA